MMMERIVDPLTAPYAADAARLLYQALRAERQIMQQPLDLGARPAAEVIDPGSGARLLLAYCEHIIEDGQWITRLEAV